MEDVEHDDAEEEVGGGGEAPAEKWTECRLALAKGKDGVYNPEAPALAATKGRPDGIERAKVASDATPAAERLQSSIEQCITNAKSNAAKRKEKYVARWSALMTKQDVKLDLLRTNIPSKKRNIDLTFRMGVDMSTMDEQVKAWYLAERGLILNQIPRPTATTAPTPMSMPTHVPTPTPSIEVVPTSFDADADLSQPYGRVAYHSSSISMVPIILIVDFGYLRSPTYDMMIIDL
ncbi:putative methionyl-tRNA synthetase [Hordeum vulgare]|nr:putative methionyl-tRNA synthetase [Hordeum vulgare]